MMKKMILILICSSIIMLSSCWDRVELNDRAIWVATGLDLADDGQIEVSGQIVVPQNAAEGGNPGGSGSSESFFVVSAKGDNLYDATSKIQNKLSRETFTGQRLVIYVGEELAKRGVKDVLDIFVRTPTHSLRGDLLIVKGTTAKEAMMLKYPLEDLPAIATLKEHRVSGGRGDQVFLHFLITSNKDGIWPSLPVIEIGSTVEELDEQQQNDINPKILKINGVGLFNKNLQLEGILSNIENQYMLWIMGLLDNIYISNKDEQMNANMLLQKLKCKITPIVSDDETITFSIQLTAHGIVQENNSSLDLRELENINKFENLFEKIVERKVKQFIEKVQSEYGLDVFGFGEVLHRKEPHVWEKVKDDWKEMFPQIAIDVNCTIKLKEVGLSGPSLLTKDSEEKR